MKPISLLILGIYLLAGCNSAAPPSHFNHVMLYVSDLDRSLDFYTAAFDVDITDKVNQLRITPEEGEQQLVEVNMAFLRFPGQNFVLELSENPSDDTDGRSPLFQHIGIDVNDIESSEGRLLAAGAVSRGPVQVVRANDIVAKNAFYTGPDGELIELMQILEGEF